MASGKRISDHPYKVVYSLRLTQWGQNFPLLFELVIVPVRHHTPLGCGAFIPPRFVLERYFVFSNKTSA